MKKLSREKVYEPVLLPNPTPMVDPATGLYITFEEPRCRCEVCKKMKPSGKVRYVKIAWLDTFHHVCNTCIRKSKKANDGQLMLSPEDIRATTVSLNTNYKLSL